MKKKKTHVDVLLLCNTQLIEKKTCLFLVFRIALKNDIFFQFIIHIFSACNVINLLSKVYKLEKEYCNMKRFDQNSFLIYITI